MSDAQNRLYACQDAISRNNEIIKKYEALYDSLLEFKGVVSDSKEQYSSVNERKKAALGTLSGLSAECKTAKTYSNGMNKVLNSVGISCVNLTFYALLASICLKLGEYKGKIEALELANASLNSEAVLLSEQIMNEGQED